MSTKNSQISTLTIVEIYKEILCGKRARFPHFTWRCSEGESNFQKCGAYLLEEVLKWDDTDIAANLCTTTFTDNKLGGVFRDMFNSSAYSALNCIYPDRFYPYDLKCSPKNTLEKYAVARTREYIEIDLKWNFDDVCRNLTTGTFRTAGMSGILMTVYSGSTVRMIQTAYPNKYHTWLLEKIEKPRNYWNDETVISSCKWLFETKLKWTHDDIVKNFNTSTLEHNHLSALLAHKYTRYNIPPLVYPNEDWSVLHIYDKSIKRNNIEIAKMVISGTIKQFPYRMISRDDPDVIYEITKYFIEDYLHIKPTIENLKAVPASIFRENNLRALPMNLYEQSDKAMNVKKLLSKIYNIDVNKLL